MKYKAIIETDDYKDFKFFEDGNGKYIHGIDAGAENNEWIVLYFKECKQDTLDKIRAEIDRQEKWLMDAGCNTYNVDIALSAIKLAVAESEVNNG